MSPIKQGGPFQDLPQAFFLPNWLENKHPAGWLLVDKVKKKEKVDNLVPQQRETFPPQMHQKTASYMCTVHAVAC